MREILFRGKTINSEEWAEGNYLYDEFSGTSAIVPYINLAGGMLQIFPNIVQLLLLLKQSDSTQV